MQAPSLQSGRLDGAFVLLSKPSGIPMEIQLLRKTEMNKTFNRGLLAAGSLALTGAANAAAVDVGAVVTDIGAQATPIGLIGAAVLLIYVGVKAFQWVRKALS